MHRSRTPRKRSPARWPLAGDQILGLSIATAPTLELVLCPSDGRKDGPPKKHNVLRQKNEAQGHHPEAQNWQKTNAAEENKKHAGNEPDPPQFRFSEPQNEPAQRPRHLAGIFIDNIVELVCVRFCHVLLIARVSPYNDEERLRVCGKFRCPCSANTP